MSRWIPNITGSRYFQIDIPKPLPIGARARAEETVEFRHTLTAYHSELPPVYSTPDMIRLMETAAFRALQHYYDPGAISVGTAIYIEHPSAPALAAQIPPE